MAERKKLASVSFVALFAITLLFAFLQQRRLTITKEEVRRLEGLLMENQMPEPTRRSPDVTSAERAEQERLRQQQLELLHLRGQAALHSQTTNRLAQELEAARAAYEKLRQVSGIDAPTGEGLGQRLALKQEYLTRDEWVKKGNATPLDTLQSLLAADHEKDRDSMLSLIDTNEMQMRGFGPGHYSVGAGDEARVLRAKVLGVQIVEQSSNEEGTAMIGTIIEKSLPQPPQDDGETPSPLIIHDTVVWHLKLGPNGWRISHRSF